MANKRSFLLIKWLLVLSWCVWIFVASTDLMSSKNTARYLGLPSNKTRTQIIAHVALRKWGHLSEYMILSGLIYNALGHQIWAFILASLYAITDEFHQSFVPSRLGCVQDVLIDVVGAAVGVILVNQTVRLTNTFINKRQRLME